MSKRAWLYLLLAAPLAAQRAIPVENDKVRVLVVEDRHVDKPGALHEHKENRVMIYVDGCDINLRFQDGRAEDQHWKAGDVAWSPLGGLHTSQHVSANTARIVEIELRKPPTGRAGSAAPAGLILDKPQIWVYRGTAAPPPGVDFIAVNMQTAETTWNRLPGGAGPYVITVLR